MTFYAPGDMTPDRSIGFQVRRIERLMTGCAERSFADSDLSFSQWVSLNLIHHGIADSCSTLSRSLGHNSGATTRLIDQLEERGLISRLRESDDRRVVTVTLTPAGEHALSLMTPRLTDLWNDVLADFKRDEVETLLTLLDRLRLAMEKHVPEAVR